ncbi:MAG: glycerol-3-phosphate 1-O-acyltransferase PlsY [Coriobacteriales bacterium]
MSLYLALIIVLVESFLLGSIPFGVIIGRVVYGKDPRDGGSGSIGMTNMARLFGKKAAAATFAGDVLKGAFAVFIARLLLPYVAIAAGWQADLVLVLGVFGSIFGHLYCPWLGFKGGKGISTGLGSILVALPPVALSILAVFLVVALISKRISAGSICAAIGFPVFSCIFYWGSVPIIATALIIGIAVVYAHRENIKRLIAGTEPKFSFEGSEKGKDRPNKADEAHSNQDDAKAGGTAPTNKGVDGA